jgi:hypothetical protein
MAKLLLVACQPKSGSTFLSRYLADMGGGKTRSFVPGFGRREQELSERRLLQARLRRERLLVGQHHVRHSGTTQKYIDRYRIDVVVLTRNLFDVIASLRDHVRREDPAGPLFYLDKDMLKMSDRELEEFLARFAIPWYLNFYMSWRAAGNAMFVRYEDMAADTDGVARRIFERFGLTVAKSALDLSAIREKSRFNKGVVGRGREISADARRMVVEQVGFYARFHDDPYLDSHLVED